MVQYDHKCLICGKPFSNNQPASKYCCPEHKAIGKSERMKIYRREHRKKDCYKIALVADIVKDKTIPFVNSSHLVRDSAEAKMAGLSYGYYMARSEGRMG